MAELGFSALLQQFLNADAGRVRRDGPDA